MEEEKKEYKLNDLSISERVFLLSSIDTKFSTMSSLVKSIQEDLGLVEFNCSNQYCQYLETLNDNIFAFSDLVFKELDPKDILEASRLY